MQYREEFKVTKPYKQSYADGIERIIEQRQKKAESVRHAYTENIFEDAPRYREELKAMLGWPLVGHTEKDLPHVITETLAEEETHSIYRMQFEILDGLTMSGLFFRAKENGKKPLVIVQHGGAGTPERISGVYGSTTNYNDMLERVIRHGVHAFAPQLLLWDEKYGAPFDRRAIDARLKRVGSSITAIEIYGITRILDYFEKQSYVSDFGMVGLSYGGFYTLFAAAVDTRIRSSVSCSFFNTRDRYGWSDWTWQNSAEKFDDAEIACLVYPRRLWIGVGNNDELFDAKYAEESFERLKALCKNAGTDWVSLTVFDGKHEFYREDAPIEQLIEDLFTK